MQKSKLDRFIQKYNLGGNVNSVKWKSTTDSLSTTFVTPDKSLLGTVKADKFQFEDAEIGVYQTDQLKSLINVLGDDISLDLSKFGDKAVSLNVKNGPVSIDYVLSDLSVIADPPALKRLPEFGTHIKLDTKFIDTFIKGKGALSDVDTFTVLNGKNGLEVIIGYSSTNTNRVNIPVETSKIADEHSRLATNTSLKRLALNVTGLSTSQEVDSTGMLTLFVFVDE